MEARERARGVDPDLAPALDPLGSDSALLDNALELLVRAGLDVREAVTLLVPPAWQNDPRIDERERAMHRFHAMLAEPWDGPAGLVFADGVVCGAALDRNGLRPLRVAVCDDGLVAVSSEAGAIPLPEGVAVRRARLGPGQLLSLDPHRGLLFDGELKRELASRKPYAAWVEESVRFADQGEPLPAPEGDLGTRHVLHGYTREELSLMLRPIAQTGQDPVYSMGDDAPIAPLAGRGRPLASYFRQRFAQVTNPAIDHYRERTVMSVATLVGARAPLDAEGRLPRSPSCRRSSSRPTALRRSGPTRSTRRSPPARGCRGGRARRRPGRRARGVRRDGRLPLGRGGGRRSGARAVAARASPRPTGGSSERGLRTACALLVSSDDARDTHMVATLVGYGADVVCPRLALETVARLADTDKVGGDRPTPAEAQARLLRSLEDGVLKVMSKMGISDVASYRGARLFEAVGLDRRLCKRFFGGTPSAIGGISLDELERDALARLAASGAEKPALENPGFYKFRKGGEPHATDPDVVEALQAERHRGARAREGRQGRAAGPLRALRRARRRADADRAARPARARPAGSRSRSTRSSRWTRSCGGSRAAPCRTARSRPRRTRRSRSR